MVLNKCKNVSTNNDIANLWNAYPVAEKIFFFFFQIQEVLFEQCKTLQRNCMYVRACVRACVCVCVCRYYLKLKKTDKRTPEKAFSITTSI